MRYTCVRLHVGNLYVQRGTTAVAALHTIYRPVRMPFHSPLMSLDASNGALYMYKRLRVRTIGALHQGENHQLPYHLALFALHNHVALQSILRSLFIRAQLLHAHSSAPAHNIPALIADYCKNTRIAHQSYGPRK